MKHRSLFASFLALAGGFAASLVCLYGYTLLLQRPGLPAEVKALQEDGARLVRIDDIEFEIAEDAEFAMVWKKVGRPVDFTLEDPQGGIRRIIAAAEPYFAGNLYPLVYLLVGVVSILIGTATRLLRPADRKARLFFWLSLAFGITTAINGDSYCLRPAGWTTFIPCLFFILGYAFAPAFLLHFSLVFGRPPGRVVRVLIYAAPALFGGILTIGFLRAFTVPSLEAFRFTTRLYDVFRLYVVAFLLAGIVRLGWAHRHSRDGESRSQIKWIFYGLAVGLAPFMFLYMVPLAMGGTPPLTEEVTALFFIIIPASFAIAIVRHRLMDIEVVISRSLVYAILTVFTVGLYLLVVQGAQRLLARVVPMRRGIFTAAGVFLAAAAFHPAQRRIQDFVDRAFFRLRYDYRKAVFDFGERACRFIRKEDLLDHFAEAVRRVLPVESLRFALTSIPATGTDAGGFAAPLAGSVGAASDGTASDGTAVLARRSAVQLWDRIDFSEETALERQGAQVALPLRPSGRGETEWLVLGKKKSEERYSRDDLELLQTMAGELAVNLERLRLQEEVVYERASREKLDELNRLKTEFISTVSHELRTPMSSIQGLAEILQAGKIKSKEQREHYLSLMAAESGRLSRFLHNVLDFGRIERQAKDYHFRKTDLRALVDEAVDVFRPAAERDGFRLEVRLPEGPAEADVDPDAVKQALINLIDNAMKYSETEKTVTVELERRDGRLCIGVRDRGIGIPPADAARIFEKFYRAEAAGRLAPQGAGLGLKIVKHIMDGHGGEIAVESEVGAGSTFRLFFREG